MRYVQLCLLNSLKKCYFKGILKNNNNIKYPKSESNVENSSFQMCHLVEKQHEFDFSVLCKACKSKHLKTTFYCCVIIHVGRIAKHYCPYVPLSIGD